MYLNGVTVHTSTPRANPVSGPRGDCKGWTPATATRQKKWLYSVDGGSLTGSGFALTLTVGPCPDDAETWARMRRAWLKRLERKWPLLRLHWVTEWQERMVPHMHVAVYFDDGAPATGDGVGRTQVPAQVGRLAMVEWLLVCDAFKLEAAYEAQDVKPIADVGGWFKYMSKHASRGANHYQRMGHPASWDKTGRMWGYVGEWPVSEPYEIPISRVDFVEIRRMMRHWARSEAACKGDYARLAYLRRAPARNNARESRFQAASEWIPEPVMLRLVEFLEHR